MNFILREALDGISPQHEYEYITITNEDILKEVL